MFELLTLWRVIDLRLLNGSSQKSATDSIPPYTNLLEVESVIKK